MILCPVCGHTPVVQPHGRARSGVCRCGETSFTFYPRESYVHFIREDSELGEFRFYLILEPDGRSRSNLGEQGLDWDSSVREATVHLVLDS